MAEVFIVTSGEYPSTNTHGVFSSREVAEQYIQKARQQTAIFFPQFNEIERWEVDAETNAKEYILYECTMSVEDGSVVYQWSLGQFGVARSNVVIDRSKGKALVLAQSGVSAEHAIQLAEEERQNWLRARAKETAEKNA